MAGFFSRKQYAAIANALFTDIGRSGKTVGVFQNFLKNLSENSDSFGGDS